MTRNRVLAAAIVAVVVATTAGGYLLGKSEAPTLTDATGERNEAYKVAAKSSYSQSFAKATVQGRKVGIRRGGKAGRKSGSRFGTSRGTDRAQDELDLIAAEQARLAAEAEAAERAANCGHVLFVESACPSDAEVQYEEDAETYCGGGDYETAAALGIQC